MKVIEKQIYIVGFRKTDNDEWETSGSTYGNQIDAQAVMNKLSKETKQQLKLFKFGRAVPLEDEFISGSALGITAAGTNLSDNDNVNHPKHYNSYSFEVVDVIDEVVPNFPSTVSGHIQNAIKYIFRAPFKGNLKQDLEKAAWYLNHAIKLVDRL